MNLTNITISGYRSINELDFKIEKFEDNSYTYCLIGENEAGKSSILRSIALKDNNSEILLTQKDFHENTSDIQIEFTYELPNKTLKSIADIIDKQPDKNKFDIKANKFIGISYMFLKNNFTPTSFINYINEEGDYDSIEFKINGEIIQLLESEIHKTIFWSFDERFLISKEIVISSFFSNPDQISVPLKNCFLLAGYKIEDFPAILQGIVADSIERESVRERLNEAVTKHIKSVWKSHPVKITFDITEQKINFHIKDLDSTSKSKMIDQRSDGFKQFISFLLTISADYKNSQLKNAILLLDEPETHLHPSAQEFFLKELINISKSNNNLVFFATHSTHFIDKDILKRTGKVFKPKEETKILQFDNKKSTYSSVNYDVFNISSSDYHNELYGDIKILLKIESTKDFDNKLKELYPKILIISDYLHTDGRKFPCTLPTFIRHQISHRENKKNDPYTESQLNVSIKTLLSILKTLERQ